MGILLALGLLVWRLSVPTSQTPEPTQPTERKEKKVERVLPMPVTERDAEPPEPVERTEATARSELHASLAEALGLIAIRCPNPGFPDTPTTGAFGARVEGGLYSALVDTPSGAMTVQARTTLGSDGPVEVVDLFRVTWEGGTPGGTVACRITAERYATRTVA